MELARVALLMKRTTVSRGDTVIANENGVALVGVNLLGELVDVDLVIVYRAAGDGVRDSPIDH